MQNSSIKTIIQVLKYIKNRQDIADLLESSFYEIDESDQYGNYAYSPLSTFIIYSPLEKFYKLKEIKESDKNLILEIVLDIYPHGANKPEITSLKFRILDRDVEMKYQHEVTKDITSNVLSIFLSHSSIDKQIASDIKTNLECYGFDVFLAHEDIEPLKEWEKEIIINLNKTDIFILILSENFKDSNWTDQETGFALAKGCLIVPIRIDGTIPWGFVNKFQALSIRKTDIDYDVKQLLVKKNS